MIKRLNYLNPSHQIYPQNNQTMIKNQVEHFMINLTKRRRFMLIITIKRMMLNLIT